MADKNLPRIETATKIRVPHESTEISFAFPSAGPDNYRNIGNKILSQNQKVPTGDYTASLIHSAYCSEAQNELEFQNVREIMKNRLLWVFNRNLWTGKGVYVIQDLKAVGRSQPLNSEDLEKKLKGGKEINGIRFSKDKLVRFAPKETYRLGEHSPESFAKDGVIVANCGVEGAEKLGEASTKFRLKKPSVYGIGNEGEEQRVAALYEGAGSGLDFCGSNVFGSGNGDAFGIFP
ncbi:hypothetical protein J4402_01090 [Candidatus Pacearchaeota archaeon]|nr:hypothetical protein [Candidatus Pacearchaeota archaeon]